MVVKRHVKIVSVSAQSGRSGRAAQQGHLAQDQTGMLWVVSAAFARNKDRSLGGEKVHIQLHTAFRTLLVRYKTILVAPLLLARTFAAACSVVVAWRDLDDRTLSASSSMAADSWQGLNGWSAGS
jgi:hypothetical protein